MKIAVTGASGFIGRHLLDALREGPDSIIALTRSPQTLDMAAKNIEARRLNLENLPENLNEVLDSPDILIHLAWGGLPHYQSLHHFEIELPKHYLFLKKAIESGVKNLLVVGTCFEYGIQHGAVSETIATHPKTPYGFAKDSLHRQLTYLKQQIPFNLTWARLFYMYGKRQSSHSIYGQLLQAVENGQPLFNMSGGEQLGDYLPVEEVAKTIVSLAKLQKDIGAVNVCSGTPISLRRLVESWIATNQWKIQLNLGHFPYREYESMAFWGSRHYLDSLIHK